MGESAAMMFMGGAAIGQAASSFITAGAQSSAIEAQGEYQKQVYEINSRLADMAAKDALARGDREEYLYRREAKKVIGAQRASYAAQGVEVDSGSALDLQMDTATQAEVGALTIRNNAYREAWGYKQESLQHSMKGEMALFSSKFEASNTLLAGKIQGLSYLTKGGGEIMKGYSPNTKAAVEEPSSSGTGAWGLSKNYLNSPKVRR